MSQPASPGACYMCQENEGSFPHASHDGGPLGLACPRCHRIVLLCGEDPAAIDVARIARMLRTIAGNRQRADMRLAIRRWQSGR